MRKWTTLFALATALVLSLGFASQAFGSATVTISDPDAAYLARTTKIDYSSIAEGTWVDSVADTNLTVTFDQQMEKRDIDGAGGSSEFSLWGYAPNVESNTAAVLFTAYGFEGSEPQSVAMELSRSVHTFGFEMAPRFMYGDGTPLNMESSVTFKLSQDDSVVAVVTRTVAVAGTDDNYDARLFSISSDKQFDKVEIVASYPSEAGLYGLGIAQLRYSESAPPVVSGTVTNASGAAPVPFARIVVEHAGQMITDTVADYRGRYSLALPPGDYTFYVSGRGWGEIDEAVTVPGTNSTRDFALTDHYEQAVYRFFNLKAGVHFYTANDAEFINTYGTLASAFKYDGIAYSIPVVGTQDTVALYRFYNPKRGVHFYTASEAEKNDVIQNHSDIYVFEGVAYQVRIDGMGTPVYRYYVPARNTHFYTVDTSEISASSGLSNHYQYEGVAYYVGASKR